MTPLAGVSHGNMRNSGTRFVRLIGIAAVVSTLSVSAPAFAQGWFEYRDLAERFQVSLPGEPAIERITYTSWQGARLPARVYNRRGRSGPLFRHGGQLLIRRGCDGCERIHRPRGVEDPQERRRDHLRCIRSR